MPAAGRPNEVSGTSPVDTAQQRQGEEGQTQKVVVLKNHGNIHKESIKMVGAGNLQTQIKDGDSYYITFQFDANYDCEITIYLCASECRNASNIPL